MGRPLFERGPSPREEFAQARRGFDAQALHSVRRNYSHGTAVFNKVRAPQFDLSTRHGLHFCSNFDCVSASRHRFAIVGYRFDSRSEEHTSELQSLMRISYAVFCLKKKKYHMQTKTHLI